MNNYPELTAEVAEIIRNIGTHGTASVPLGTNSDIRSLAQEAETVSDLVDICDELRAAARRGGAPNYLFQKIDLLDQRWRNKMESIERERFHQRVESKLTEGTSDDLDDVVKRIFDNGTTILSVGKHLMTVAKHYGAHEHPKVLERAQEILKHTSTAAFLCAQLNGKMDKFGTSGGSSADESDSGSDSGSGSSSSSSHHPHLDDHS